MNELKNKADRFAQMLQERGAAKYSFLMGESERQEFNTEGGDFKLLRTAFSGSASLSVFRDGRKGSASGNDLSEEGLLSLIDSAMASAESAPVDPAHDIAPREESRTFRLGVEKPDPDRFFERLRELMGAIEKEFPLINVMQLIGDCSSGHSILRTSNGTEFERYSGAYNVDVEFSASDGRSNTGLDYTFVQTDSLEKPLLDLGDLRRKLDDAQKQLNPSPLSGKYEGTLVFTPDCLGDFISMTLVNYVSGSVILDGTSQWLDKIGEKVADESLTVRFDPFDSRIVCGERYTGDGFLSEPVTVIENGVLKTFLLSLYVANKTGRPVTKNAGSALIVNEGSQSLEELIASVPDGLLVGGFSGGQPGANGEFSGVAKNSFRIENGKVSGPVSETMISGNLGEMWNHIRGISKETCRNGAYVLPYMAVDGIVISGK